MNYKIIFLLISLLVIFISGCDMNEEEINAKMKTDKAFSKANELCNSLPLPSDVRLLKRYSAGNSKIGAIEYVFKYEDTRNLGDYFSNYLYENGWTLVEGQNKFEKDKHIIALHPGTDKTYLVYCQVSREL